MLKTYIFLLFIISALCTFFFSCGEIKDKQNNGGTQVIFQLQNPENLIREEEIVKARKFIPLEFREETAIGRVDKLIIRDDKIFVLDKRGTKAVLVFDLNGNFLNKIGNIGKGPSEYIELFDFEVAKNGVFLLSNSPRKILSYHADGKFKSERSFNFWTRSFAMIEENLYAFNQQGRFNRNKEFQYNIITADNSDLINKYFPYPKVYEDDKIIGWYGMLGKTSYSILYSPIFSPAIFRLNKEALDTAYVFSVGDKALSVKELTFDGSESSRIQENSLLAFKSGKIFQFRNYYENENFFVCSFYFDLEEWLFYFSKKSKEYYIKGFRQMRQQELVGGIAPYGISNNYIIGVIELDKILEIKKCLNDKNCNYRERIVSDGFEYLKDTDGSVNPIVVLWNMRND